MQWLGSFLEASSRSSTKIDLEKGNSGRSERLAVLYVIQFFDLDCIVEAQGIIARADL